MPRCYTGICRWITEAYCQEIDAGYDGTDDQTETKETEEAGSSFSLELLHGEETEEVIDPEEDKDMLDLNT